MKLISKAVVNRPSARGNVAFESSYYVAASGLEKVRVQSQLLRSDICDPPTYSFSDDNGLTWGEPLVRPIEQPEQGVLRVWESPGFVDPINGLLLTMVMEGVLLNDDPLEGMTSYYLKYRVSDDGGRSDLVEEHIVQKSGGYSPEHPFEPVWAGKNALMLGGENSILRAPQGHLVLATMITPLGPDGNYYNPCGVTTYTEVAILFGHWQPHGRIEWELGPRLVNPPIRSTRGAMEPTMALMDDGRILLVMRGSNESDLQLPGVKWYAVSEDGGRSWSEIQPWGYSNGESFHSPSSSCQLLRHSTGKYYWFGNICPENPQANEPRYPLVGAEVDPVSLLLQKETLFEVQGYDPGGMAYQQYSNFNVHEDRPPGDLLLHMTSLFIDDEDVMEGDAYLYRLAVNGCRI